MKKGLSVLLITLLLALMMAVPASAGHRIPAEGTAALVFGSWDSRTTTDVDGKCIIQTKNGLRIFTGTLSGEGREDMKVVSQGPCEGIYPGRYDDHFWIKGTFEGEVDGRKGTCRYVAHAETWAGDPPIMDIRMKLMSCRGELQGMNGKLYMGWEDPYWGWVHFARED